MKGQIKTKDITKVIQGMQVLTPNGIGIVISGIKSLSNEYAVGFAGTGKIEDYSQSKLKTLVVHYLDGFKPLEITLGYNDWLYATQNDKVNSYNEIHFKIENEHADEFVVKQFATIISEFESGNKSRSYSEADLKAAFEAGREIKTNRTNGKNTIYGWELIYDDFDTYFLTKK